MEMMLKITKIQESRSEVLIKLEGKITAEWAVLLDRECRVLLREEKAVSGLRQYRFHRRQGCPAAE